MSSTGKCLLLAAVLLGGCGGRSRVEAPEAARPVVERPVVEPAGVDPALLRSATLSPGDPEEKCSAGGPYRARCLQARAHPEVPFVWVLFWDEHVVDERGDHVTRAESELLARRQRVFDRLQADGAVDIVTTNAAQTEAVVTATHAQVRGVLALPDVEHVEVSCAESDHEFCACGRLRVDQREQHAFCGAMRGRPLRPGAACSGPLELAGCTRAELCQFVMALALDPNDKTWLFSSGCLPEQPGWRPVPEDMRPGLQAAVEAPHCPEP